ncbi:hypothetical protein RAS1_31260 [Phycisphaerae bacterium RAS1]|nr:hypothetical protein RAS1_31260 [Phycisphaerae bacterium RAS1]
MNRMEQMSGHLIETIEAIVASKEVKKFVVGITRNPRSRQGNYRYVDIPYFAALAFNLELPKARELERLVRKGISDHPKNKHRRQFDYQPGGGRSGDQCLYVAWW